MRKIIPFLLAFLLSLPSFCYSDTLAFQDINGHWASKDIELAYQKGMMKGISPEFFIPEGELTRAELAVCLDRIFDFNFDNIRFVKAPSVTDYFDDVAENLYYSQSVMEIGFFNVLDIKDRKFNADQPVTRIEVANAIAKCFELKHLNVVTIQMWPEFKDMETTSALAFIHNAGIMRGTGKGYFAPSIKITRAEFAVILNRTMNTVKLAQPVVNVQQDPVIQKIDIRGEVKSLVREDDKISAIYGEGILSEDILYDKAYIKLTADTDIATCAKGAASPVQDLHEGSIVEVIFSGPVTKASPVQATADKLRIIK